MVGGKGSIRERGKRDGTRIENNGKIPRDKET